MTEPAHEPDSVDRELEELLADAESTVSRLRRELELRRGTPPTEPEARAQHAEIDRLREHLAQAQVHWDEVRAFFEAALQELLGDREAKAGGGDDEEH